MARAEWKIPLAGLFLYVMKKDDETFDMKKGDIFFGAPYPHDGAKTSIAFRVSDGFDPGCNQYNSSIRPLTAEEVDEVLWKKRRSVEP